MFIRNSVVLALGVAFVSGGADAASVTIEAEVLAIAARDGSGTGTRPLLDFLSTPRVLSSGDVFATGVRDKVDGAGTEQGWFILQGQDFEPVVLRDQPAPGVDTPERIRDILFFSPASATEAGFQSRTSPGRPVIWHYAGGELQFVTRERFVMPGTGGALLDLAGNFWIDADTAGNLAFAADLVQTPGITDNLNDAGIWTRSEGVLDLLIQAGGTAPGTDGGVISRFFAPTFIAPGEFVFGAELFQQLNGVTASDDRGLWGTGVWADAGGGPGLIVREGDSAEALAPDVFDPGAVIRQPGSIHTNGFGDFTFVASVLGSPVGFSGTVWVTSGDQISFVAASGQPAPGTGGLLFDRLRIPQMNARGDVVFLSELASSPSMPAGSQEDTGLWLHFDGELRLVVREGDVAPGTGGEVFDSLAGPGSFYITASGDVVFTTDVLNFNTSNDTGVWFYSAATDSLRLIVREDDLVDVSLVPGQADERRVDVLQVAGASSVGGVVSFDVFLEFDDSSEALIRFTPAVPTCEGDTNGDLMVDTADLLTVLANFNAPVLGAAEGDLNGDLVVNTGDLLVLLSNFNTDCSR